MKRTLCLLLTFFMVIAAALPAIAYADPNPSGYTSDWKPEFDAEFNNSNLAVTESGATATYSFSSAGTGSAGLGTKYSAGTGGSGTTSDAAFTTGYNRALVFGMNTTSQVAYSNAMLKWNYWSKQLGSPEGATLDMSMKFDALPAVAIDGIEDTNYNWYGPFVTVEMDENGNPVVSIPLPEDPTTGNSFTTTHVGMAGLAMDVHFGLCPGDSTVNPTNPGGRELYISFNQYPYTNPATEEYTNGLITLIMGNRNSGWGTIHEAVLCNLDVGPDAEYHRYTFSYDMNDTDADGKKLTLYCDGAVLARFTDIATRNNLQTADFCYANLSNRGFHAQMWYDQEGNEHANEGTVVSFDAMQIYNTPITPNGATVGSFNETPPLDTEAMDTLVNVTKDFHENLYTAETWGAMQSIVDDYAAADRTAMTNEDVEQYAADLSAAIDALVFNNIDRLYIGQTASTENNGTSWTNGAVLFTEAGFALTDYRLSTYTLAAWTRITAAPVSGAPGVYRITNLINGESITGAMTPVTNAEVVPEGGFIFCFHKNVTTGTTTWNPSAGGSQYASQEFGNRNVQAFNNLNLGVDSLITLENVGYSSTGDSTLATTGTWVHRYATPAPVKTPLYRTSGTANSAAVEDSDPQYLAQDQFDGFETTSYIMPRAMTPNLDVTISGEGTVTPTFDGHASDSINEGTPGAYFLGVGTQVSLTANGENFAYWENTRNQGVVSTEPTIAFTFKMSPMALRAVFQAPVVGETTQYAVTFKDGITGKILSTFNANAGETVSSENIPASPALYGYTFVNWYAAGERTNPISHYVINEPTVFVGLYTRNAATSATLTVVDGVSSNQYARRFGMLTIATANGSNFSYWQLDGTVIASTRLVQFSMPNHDCTLQAVYNSVTTFTPSTSMVACFVDENGSMILTLNRDIPTGYTLVESGVLMTRKALPTELYVGSTANITRGVSSADESKCAFGFVKSGMFAKAGTWYVRGYLTYQDSADNVVTIYTVTNVLEVSSSGAVQGEVMWSNTAFDLEGELDPFAAAVKPYQCTTADGNYGVWFPTVTQAEDGTLIVVYYYSNAHALYNQSEGSLVGVLKMVKSTDAGATWSEPATIVDLTENGTKNRESRDPNLQKMSDGTLVLTFPSREALDQAHPGLNGSSPNDYWYGRTYYMTSVDNGVTWSNYQEVPCNFFSDGQAYAWNSGWWVKNGSFAELANGDLLFPLYGAPDCSTRATMQSVVVKGHNNGDGTITWDSDWVSDGAGGTTDAVIINNPGEGNELALWANGTTVYGLARTAIPSETAGAPVYRSTDSGETWTQWALEPTPNDCLNQPNFTFVSPTMALVNYSVPLASTNVDSTGAALPAGTKRTSRAVYGKLFNLETEDWNEYTAITIYDVSSATVADMGNPASVLLDDGRLFTVFYDISAPALRKGFIGGQYTKIENYTPTGGGSGTISTDTLVSENFNGASVGAFASSEKVSIATQNPASGTVATEIVAADTTNRYLSITAQNKRAATYAKPALLTSETFNDNVFVQFDYNFATDLADNSNGSRNRIYVTLYDTGSGATSGIPYVYITPGALVFDEDGLTTTTADRYTHNFPQQKETWYTFKAMYLGGTFFLKAWARGTAEPDWTASYAVPLAMNNKVSVLYDARSSSTSTADTRTILLDNFSVTRAALAFDGIYPQDGLSLQLGKTARMTVKFDTTLSLTGAQMLSAYSDNPAVAQLNADGTVTAVGKGKATIYVQYQSDTYSCAVTVS